jgi:hypothetical protein
MAERDGLVLGVLATQPTGAEPISFRCSFSDGTACVPVPGIPNSWINPAIGENEPADELSMNIDVLGATFVSTPQLYTISEPHGSISDQLLLINAGNQGQIMFFSDPLIPIFIILGDPLIPVPISVDLGTETEVGIAANFTAAISEGISQSLLQVSVFSDGEAFFDPFGIGVDTGDAIQVRLLVPEPGSSSILIIGLASVGYLHIRRSKRGR